MRVTALVMAGGKGARMEHSMEKPLLKVGGMPMIEHVLGALNGAGRVDDIVVAVSENTPETARLMGELGVKTLDTPGVEYHHDLGYAIKELGLDTVLTTSADLPLVDSGIIDRVLERYLQAGKPALTVLVPMERKEELGTRGGYVYEIQGRRLTPAGVNVIDGRRIDGGEMEEELFIIDDARLALNVNTVRDLEIAERLYRFQGEFEHIG